MTFSTTCCAGRMLRQQLISLCARVHKRRDIKVKEAEAEAKANELKSKSITDKLIRMKEAEARLKHGWVTVQSKDAAVVVDSDDN